MSYTEFDCILNALLAAVGKFEEKYDMSLQEALNKQVAKLCEKEHPIFNEFDEIDHWEGECPNCKEIINFSEDKKYCDNCGQALKYE